VAGYGGTHQLQETVLGVGFCKGIRVGQVGVEVPQLRWRHLREVRGAPGRLHRRAAFESELEETLRASQRDELRKRAI
jgi:hypothetical protein